MMVVYQVACMVGVAWHEVLLFRVVVEVHGHAKPGKVDC